VLLRTRNHGSDFLGKATSGDGRRNMQLSHPVPVPVEPPLHASLAVISIDKTKLSVASVLRTRGLAAIGRISYGVYLYHLPIFVLLGVNTGTGATPTLGHMACRGPLP